MFFNWVYVRYGSGIDSELWLVSGAIALFYCTFIEIYGNFAGIYSFIGLIVTSVQPVSI